MSLGDYKKLIRKIKKCKELRIDESGRTNGIKVIHIKSGDLYSVHPGSNAVKPLNNWIRKQIGKRL